MSDSEWPHRRQPTRLPCPWDSPGKNTGVGCHFLLQCMKLKSESEVTQLCLTLSDPMDCSLPGSSVHGIFQARVLEWVAIAFSAWHVNYLLSWSFSCGSDGKESACNVGDSGSIPALGRSPGEGNGNTLEYSCLENPMDRGAWQATVHGVTKSQIRLNQLGMAYFMLRFLLWIFKKWVFIFSCTRSMLLRAGFL